MQLIFLTIKKGYAWFAGIFGLSPDSPPLGYAPLLRLAILLTGKGKLMNLDRVAAFFFRPGHEETVSHRIAH